MRNVNTYQSTTLAAPTNRAVRSAGRLHATYAPRGSVVAIATSRPIRAARRSATRAQLGHNHR